MFALGVTAYRLVTDTYPPLPLPDMKAGECWRPGGSGPPPPRQLNPRVDAQLNALIVRMLSLRPEERGTARELAEAMARGVEHAGPSADTLLFEWETSKPSQWTEEERAEAELPGPPPTPQRPGAGARGRAGGRTRPGCGARRTGEGPEVAALAGGGDDARVVAPRATLWGSAHGGAE